MPTARPSAPEVRIALRPSRDLGYPLWSCARSVSAVFSGNRQLKGKDNVMLNEDNLDQNKELSRRYYEECWNQGKMERLEQYVAKDCRYHDPAFPSLTSGIDSL